MFYIYTVLVTLPQTGAVEAVNLAGRVATKMGLRRLYPPPKKKKKKKNQPSSVFAKAYLFADYG